MKNHNLFSSLISDIYDRNKNTLWRPYTMEPKNKRIQKTPQADASFYLTIKQNHTDKNLIITEMRKDMNRLHDAKQLHESECLSYDKEENPKQTLLLHGYSNSDTLVLSYSEKNFSEYRIISKAVTKEQALEIISLFFDGTKVNRYKLSPFDILS